MFLEDVGVSLCLKSVLIRVALSLKCLCTVTSVSPSYGDRLADTVSECQDIQMTHCGSRFFGRPVLRIRRHWALNPSPLLFVYLFLV